MAGNVGPEDRIVRAILAAVVAVLAYIFELWWLYILAIVIVATSISGFAPIYVPFRIDTNRRPRKTSHQKPLRHHPRPQVNRRKRR